jgi:HK97 family phage major capsid protein
MKLSEMYEKRKALSTEIDNLTNGTTKLTSENELRASQMLEDLDGMDAEIRRVGLRDRLDAGGITSHAETGRPAQALKSEFRDWISGGFRSDNKFEVRANTTVATLGGATDIASSIFTEYVNRDSVVRNLASVVTTDSGAPLVFYRQTAQFAAATSVTATSAAFTEKAPTAEKVTFTMTKMGFYTLVANEALTDLAWDVATDTIRQHAELHAANRDLAYSNVTYAAFAQPIYDYTTSGTSNALSLTTAAPYGTGGITLAEATTAVYGTGLKTPYLKNAAWLLPNAVWAKTIAAASATLPVFGQSAGYSVARDGAGLNFLGYPVYLSNNLPTSAATTVAYGVFGDIQRGYRIVEQNAVPFMADPYTFANAGQTQFLSSTRAYGAIMDRNAMVSLFKT